MYPKIYLSIDNCFASKRWTTPDEWSCVIAGLDIHYIEASADTELDPLYMGLKYLQDWVQNAKQAQQDHGVRVSSLYSGHGTYSTLGLAHTDARVRERMMEQWFKPLIRVAAQMECGMGFYAHAFSESVLQDPDRYQQNYDILIKELSELSAYAKEQGCRFLAVEQMYSPNQIPFTIEGTRQMLRQIYRESGAPFYFTEDVGHHLTKFLRPTRQQLRQALLEGNSRIWLGSAKTHHLFADLMEQKDASEGVLNALEQSMDAMPYFFATAEDGDCYRWLEELGCYSPIIHLQQTNGQGSKHEPFTEEANQRGIVHPARVLRALKASYDQPEDETLPPRCDEIYLTMELFSGTASAPAEILDNYQKTVDYWRQFIPQDGIDLAQLLEAIEE